MCRRTRHVTDDVTYRTVPSPYRQDVSKPGSDEAWQRANDDVRDPEAVHRPIGFVGSDFRFRELDSGCGRVIQDNDNNHVTQTNESVRIVSGQERREYPGRKTAWTQCDDPETMCVCVSVCVCVSK